MRTCWISSATPAFYIIWSIELELELESSTGPKFDEAPALLILELCWTNVAVIFFIFVPNLIGVYCCSYFFLFVPNLTGDRHAFFKVLGLPICYCEFFVLDFSWFAYTLENRLFLHITLMKGGLGALRKHLYKVHKDKFVDNDGNNLLLIYYFQLKMHVVPTYPNSCHWKKKVRLTDMPKLEIISTWELRRPASSLTWSIVNFLCCRITRSRECCTICRETLPMTISTIIWRMRALFQSAPIRPACSISSYREGNVILEFSLQALWAYMLTSIWMYNTELKVVMAYERKRKMTASSKLYARRAYSQFT